MSGVNIPLLTITDFEEKTDDKIVYLC